jgi:hypothetical protein
MNLQTDKKAKESFFKEWLNNKFAGRIKWSDERTDYEDGIDCWIDDVPYDIKATRNNKLTIFKIYSKYPDNPYSPLLNHPDVRYLLPPIDGDGTDYVRTYSKRSVMDHLRNNPKTGIFTGDGNINYWIDISNLLYKPLKCN